MSSMEEDCGGVIGHLVFAGTAAQQGGPDEIDTSSPLLFIRTSFSKYLG